VVLSLHAIAVAAGLEPQPPEHDPGTDGRRGTPQQPPRPLPAIYGTLVAMPPHSRPTQAVERVPFLSRLTPPRPLLPRSAPGWLLHAFHPMEGTGGLSFPALRYRTPQGAALTLKPIKVRPSCQ
jgi:hypothetical protein